MADFLKPPPPFTSDAGAEKTSSNWGTWKKQFEVYLSASGLDGNDVPGKRKVNLLLHCMGPDAIKLFGTFDFKPAVAADDANNIPAVEGEKNDDLPTVLKKFDAHYGSRKFRNVRRQAFLNRTQDEGENVMDFIADLKAKAHHCEYGEAEESILIDRIIQGVRNSHVKMRLLDLEDDELTLSNCIRVCRASELTQSQLKDEKPVHKASAQQSSSRSRGRGRRPRSRGSSHAYGRGSRAEDKSRSTTTYNICNACCRRHEPGRCPAYISFCAACGGKGHFARSTI